MQLVYRQPVIQQQLDSSLPPLLDKVLRQRGIQSVEDIDLNAKSLLHYKNLNGIEKATQLVVNAIQQNRKICIVGDFDADGATSTALCLLCLKAFGHTNYSYIVPNRFDYGYGLSPPVADLAAAENTEVLITVDNGIASFEGVSHAKQLGMQVIVTDHHLPAEGLPDADAIVNPNLHECGFPSKNLAGVGVAFYLMLSIRASLQAQGYFDNNGLTNPNIAQFLDIVALGTVADVVPLDQNNRILVHQGLQRIRSGNTRPGIMALLQVAKRSHHALTSADLGFALGPRLNAAGRLEDMSIGIECLLCEDMHKARQLAVMLDELNVSRREIEQSMQTEAEQALSGISLNPESLPAGLCVYNPTFHAGVVGIVAGRLKEKYYRPTIVFAQENENVLKGSARSIPGLHMRDTLDLIDKRAPHLIHKFGGHAMAAGLSISPGDYDAFAKLFAEAVAEAAQGLPTQQQTLSDGVLESRDLNLENAKLLKWHIPWGQQFEAPVFDGVFELVQQRIVGQKHLKMVVKKDNEVLDAIAFNVDTNEWPNQRVTHVHLAYQLDVNEYQQRVNVQLLVEQLMAVKSLGDHIGG